MYIVENNPGPGLGSNHFIREASLGVVYSHIDNFSVSRITMQNSFCFWRGYGTAIVLLVPHEKRVSTKTIGV
jgi:hypothetical protein